MNKTNNKRAAAHGQRKPRRPRWAPASTPWAWRAPARHAQQARALCRQQGGTVRSGDEAAAMVAKVMEGGV